MRAEVTLVNVWHGTKRVRGEVNLDPAEALGWIAVDRPEVLLANPSGFTSDPPVWRKTYGVKRALFPTSNVAGVSR